MRIYLDVRCLKRPFDDQRSERVRREARIVTEILAKAERGGIELVRSPALDIENDANPREDRRLAAALWIGSMVREVPHGEGEAARGRALAALGFRALDAMHVAYAEASAADYFVSCDDALLRVARRKAGAIRVKVVDPGELPAEVRE